MSSIKPRGKGWQITVELGTDPVTGKRRRHIEIFRGKQSEAKARRTELENSVNKGVYTRPSKLTLAQHLTDWLQGYAAARTSERTAGDYGAICRKHIIPALGHLPLTALQPATIQKFYGQIQSGRSPKTVLNVHRVLSEALQYAVRREILVRNPCNLTDPPNPEADDDPKEMRTLTPEEVDAVLEAAAGEPQWYPIIYTALRTGMRQGELLALRWRDVDLDLASIYVTRSVYKRKGRAIIKAPKTKAGRRHIDISPQLALYLRGYRERQEAIAMELESPIGGDDLVFPSIRTRGIASASSVYHAWKRISRKAGIEDARFHDLRHTFATMLLLAGVHPKVVSEMLGHSKVSITLDIYSHVLPSMQRDAVQALDDILSRR